MVWLLPRAASTAARMAGLRELRTEPTTASSLSEIELLLEVNLLELLDEPLFDAELELEEPPLDPKLVELMGNVLEELMGNVLEELIGNVLEELLGNVLEEPLFAPKFDELPRVELEKLLSLNEIGRAHV